MTCFSHTSCIGASDEFNSNKRKKRRRKGRGRCKEGKKRQKFINDVSDKLVIKRPKQWNGFSYIF